MFAKYAMASLLLMCASLPAIAQTPAPPPPIPKAITADPPVDSKYPARFEVLHIPSGGVSINGIALVAAGKGPHPTFVLFHGLPGNEKNLDLAQAVRRAGWTVVTINYRGSWGSPGKFSFAQNLEDARNTLTYLRDPATAAKLGLDTKRIVIAGHSMGGWVTLETAAADNQLAGAILISAADMGGSGVRGKANRAIVLKTMQDNMETLASTPEAMADELIANGPEWSFDKAALQLKDSRMLVLYSKDGLQQGAMDLVSKLKAAGNANVQSAYVVTDHGWSDKRVTLQALVINWLDKLPKG
jgi:pimeloyl-ACP methyl ester carboxylesterase